jgi:nickel-dependent lactate racemase
MTRIDLPYGRQVLPISLPDSCLAWVITPQPVKPAADARSLVASALDQPIGTLPLSQLVKPGQTLAVIVDDYSRKTPVALFLPLVLERLHMAGMRQADIRLVMALGTHRPMTEDELDAKLGSAVAAEYEIVNLPSTAASEMVYLGMASNGIPAWVHRVVAEAHVRIGLGMITPHMDAGFSGGAKIILPGVCSAQTVDAFHAASAFIPMNQLGNVESPLRRNLEQFVAERVPLDFIVNVVLTLDGEIYQCVAGHPVQAHRIGVEYAKAVFGVQVKGRYPVVVANCHPYDVDLWQSAKGAFCGDLITADGGTLVLVTAAPEGNSSYPLVPYYAGRNPDALKREIQSGQVEDAKQAVGGIQFTTLKSRLNLALVSAGLTRGDAMAIGMSYFETVETAVAEAVSRLATSERSKSVAVIPQAGIVLPLVI